MFTNPSIHCFLSSRKEHFIISGNPSQTRAWGMIDRGIWRGTIQTEDAMRYFVRDAMSNYPWDEWMKLAVHEKLFHSCVHRIIDLACYARYPD